MSASAIPRKSRRPNLAIGLIKKRLSDAYGPEIEKTYQVIGEPTSLPDAEELVKADR